MFFRSAALLFVILLSLGLPSPVQAKLYADCTLGIVNAWERIESNFPVLKLSGELPSSSNLRYSCILKTDNGNSLLYMRAKRQGSVHPSIYSRDQSVLQGHLDITKSALCRSLSICPSANEVEKYFTFSGKPGVVFTAEVSQDQEVKLNDPKPFEINQWNPINVFHFIPPEDISKTQLDVTVTSDSDVPAYLKVSQDCKDVTENIHGVDYETESIRLSFAKKGRISLSKVSFPPLTDSSSSWFIGMALNNASGTTEFNARKSVTLTLTRSFNYSYALPISFIVFVPLACGFVVALWAVLCLKEPHVYLRTCANNSESRPTCYYVSVLKAMPKITSQYWLRGEKNTFPNITAIVGWVLFVGAVQLVFADWYLMINVGDRDSCYYNDFCYRVWAYDIPFNLMISNLTYIIHAIILALSVLIMEAELFVRCEKLVEVKKTDDGEQKAEGKRLPTHEQNYVTKCVAEHELTDENYAETRKRKVQSFSIGYAFAWALFFKGMFSTLNHLCSSRMTFQFDTAFTFTIAGLIVTLLCNSNVGAANFFLGFVVPLIFFNYFASLYNSEVGLNRFIEIPFFISLLIWYLMIAAWVFHKLHLKTKWSVRDNMKVIFFMVCLAAPIVCLLLVDLSFPDAFLFTCIAESVIAAFWRAIEKLKRFPKSSKRGTKCRLFLQAAFFVAALVILIAAVWVFLKKPSTNKTKTPEKSRNLNHECAIFGFFDWHDIWHILFSFALMMGVYCVMFISCEPPISAANEPSETPVLLGSQGPEDPGVKRSGHNEHTQGGPTLFTTYLAMIQMVIICWLKKVLFFSPYYNRQSKGPEAVRTRPP